MKQTRNIFHIIDFLKIDDIAPYFVEILCIFRKFKGFLKVQMLGSFHKQIMLLSLGYLCLYFETIFGRHVNDIYMWVYVYIYILYSVLQRRHTMIFPLVKLDCRIVYHFVQTYFPWIRVAFPSLSTSPKFHLHILNLLRSIKKCFQVDFNLDIFECFTDCSFALIRHKIETFLK